MSKTAVKLQVWLVRATLSQVRVSRTEGFFASLVGPAATVSLEMMFGCQKLR